MCGADSRSEPPARQLARIRARGRVAVAFAAGERGTYAATVAEADGYRVRFPRGEAAATGVVINTGGGVAGGDEIAFDVSAGAGADAVATSQSAERIYRSSEQASRVTIRLRIDSAARLCWLPQETIVYSGARLARTIEVDVAPDGRLLLAEMLVLGRRAMGETMAAGSIIDQWRIRRDGRLILAEAVRLDGAIEATLARAPVAGGAHVLATLVYVGPDPGDRLERVRGLLADAPLRIAASSWNGLLVVRGIGVSPEAMRRQIGGVVSCLTGRPLPRVWAT